MGSGKGEVKTIIDCARIEQNPSNEKPTGEETRGKMVLGRLKGTTARIQHTGSFGQDPMDLYTPKEALLNMFEKQVEIEALEKADTRVWVTMGARQERAKGAECVEWSAKEVYHINRDSK